MATHIGQWTLTPISFWHTNDNRFIFYNISGQWMLRGNNPSDRQLLINAGIPQSLGLNLRQCITLCVELSGCSHRINRNHQSWYQIEPSPLQLRQWKQRAWGFGKHLQKDTEDIRYGRAEDWAKILSHLQQYRYRTRTTALEALTEAVDEWLDKAVAREMYQQWQRNTRNAQ